MCHLQINDEIAQRDFHMAEVVIGEKTWDRFDYDIMLWSDRGKGRANIVAVSQKSLVERSQDPQFFTYRKDCNGSPFGRIFDQ